MRDLIIEILRSGAFSAFAVGVLALIGAWIVKKYPPVAKYRGVIIKAVRLAEKTIPDDTPNAGLARADAALKMVVLAFSRAEGRLPSAPEAVALEGEIAAVHNEVIG